MEKKHQRLVDHVFIACSVMFMFWYLNDKHVGSYSDLYILMFGVLGVTIGLLLLIDKKNNNH